MIHEIKLLPYVEVYFPKLDEVLASDRVVKRDVGELVLNGKCLGGRVNDGCVGGEIADIWRLDTVPSTVIQRGRPLPSGWCQVCTPWTYTGSPGGGGWDELSGSPRMFGLHRDTVSKMLSYSVPPG